MNSCIAWAVLAAVAVTLGAVGYHFSLHTLRRVVLFVALGTAGYLVVYGLTHPTPKAGSLSDAFARGADTVSSALIRPLPVGVHVPVPGRVGWLVIVILLVLGYRWLEAWALRRQAPCLDVSELTSDRTDNPAHAGTAGQAGQAGQQRHDWLVAELKFRLPTVEVRSPAILPGGSRPNGLASIAEATGVNGAGLAGAIIRFFGMVWPSPSQIQVRAWVERTPGKEGVDDVTRVTVGLTDRRSGTSIATKTLAAGNLDDAVAAVAGFVARNIFALDGTVPPWSASATPDGGDLAALLRARQVQGYPESHSDMREAWKEQIAILKGVARRDLCSGVVRYELAQLYDLTGRHVEALLLHAANREQYPRFYRGRYRLAMSLEMLANPGSTYDKNDMTVLKKALEILDRCGVPEKIPNNFFDEFPKSSHNGLPRNLRGHLLAAAWQEFQAVQRYLTWWHIIWDSFRYRNERAVLRPYRRLRHRQAFYDGVCVALLVVAVRQALLSESGTRPRLGHVKRVARIATAISGGSGDFAEILQGFPDRTAKKQPIIARLRTRRWPWQCSTPSWPAAYNLACAYAALTAGANNNELDCLVEKVKGSLEFALCNPECEMERPSEWIGNDPDFSWLRNEKNKRFATFLHDQEERDYPGGASKPLLGAANTILPVSGGCRHLSSVRTLVDIKSLAPRSLASRIFMHSHRTG